MAMVIGLGATALGAIGKLGSGFASSSLAQLQESIANSNAALLQQQAGMQAQEGQLSLDEGALQQSRTVAQINSTLGAETGKFAASNLDPTYGSPLLLEGFSAAQGATDLALEGAKASLGYAGALQTSAQTVAQAASQTGQAVSFGMQSSNDIMSAIFGAGTTLLGGLGKSSTWSALSGATSAIASGAGNFLGNMLIPGNWGSG